jgi:hypothetical protein
LPPAATSAAAVSIAARAMPPRSSAGTSCSTPGGRLAVVMAEVVGTSFTGVLARFDHRVEE